MKPLVFTAVQAHLFRHVGRCSVPADATISAADTEAIVYSTPSAPHSSILYGCVRSVGAAIPLGSSWVSSDQSRSVRVAGMAGHQAAVVSEEQDKASGSQTLSVDDLATGQSSVAAGCAPYDCLGQVVINPAGFVAWEQGTGNRFGFALTGISCPSVSLCVAVDSFGNVLTSTNPASGPSAWSRTAVEQEGSFTGISCDSTTRCVAVDDQGNAVSSNDAAGGTASWNTASVDPGHKLTGISCTSGLCAAADDAGQVLTSTDPTAGAGAWTAALVDPGHQLSGLSCPSSTLCVADDGTARVLTSSNPTGGALSWSATPVAGAPASDNSLSLGTVSCLSVSFCLAAGIQWTPAGQSPAAGGRVAASTNPTGGTSAWSTSHVPTPLTRLVGVSCPSTELCATVDATKDALTSNDPTSSQPDWSGAFLGGNGSTTGIACPSTTLCVTVNDQGQASTSNNPQANPSTWTSTTIDPACSTPGSCTIEDLDAKDGHGTRLIDQTPGDNLADLALTGNTLTWTHDGTPRTAKLG